MKKISMFIICVLLLSNMAACAKNTAETTQSQAPEKTEIATPEPTAEQVPEPTPDPVPTPEPIPKPADFLGEKYNPFYNVKWPEGYKFTGYMLLNGLGINGIDEKKAYNESITYGIEIQYECDVDEDSEKRVLTYITNLIDAQQNVDESLSLFQEGYYFVFLDGYLDELGSEVTVSINAEPGNSSIIIDMRISLDDMDGYDIDDYIEIIELNFEEDIIPDWMGNTKLFEEQEPLYSTLMYSTTGYWNGLYLSSSRDYGISKKDGEKYINELSVYSDGSILGDCNGVVKRLELELEEGMLEVSHFKDAEYISFSFYSDDLDKNISEHNWELKLPE